MYFQYQFAQSYLTGWSIIGCNMCDRRTNINYCVCASFLLISFTLHVIIICINSRRRVSLKTLSKHFYQRIFRGYFLNLHMRILVNMTKGGNCCQLTHCLICLTFKKQKTYECDFVDENVEVLGYGPRLVVRSIKKIKKGEEVTVAYTDILQSKVCFKLFLLFMLC